VDENEAGIKHKKNTCNESGVWFVPTFAEMAGKVTLFR
tara:strand:+ start:601 stop:714 length:114 start_codon:yes stop_codon:yes gene_type:complete